MSEDAKKILSYLLSTLQSKDSRHHVRYGNYLRRNPEQIENVIFNCLRPGTLNFLKTGNLSSIDSIKSIGGDTNYQGRGVYLHAIVGLDTHIRIYIGQASNISFRLKKQHLNFRYRRDNKSLHYYALERSSYDSFCILAKLPSNSTKPGMDRPDLLLNILEMWCCLLFRSLPPPSLRQFLPPTYKVLPVAPPGSLNIAVPLDQGTSLYAQSMKIDLRHSKDPLILEYFSDAKEQKPAKIVLAETVPTEFVAASETSDRKLGPYFVAGLTVVAAVMIFSSWWKRS